MNENNILKGKGFVVNAVKITKTTAGYASLVLVITFLILLTLLHFLEPEFNSPHLISEYELGNFGFLMSLAFFCLGTGSLFLARAIWSDLQTKGGHLGRWWLLFIGIAYIGAGIFTPDPASIVESRLHGIFGIIVIFSSPIVFTLLSRSIVHHEQWSVVPRIVTWMTILTWLGLISFYASIFIFYGMARGSDPVVVGLMNRFMIAAYSAWLITVAWQTIKISTLKRGVNGD
jgi:hypothetical protein